jgi:hypothetical protein
MSDSRSAARTVVYLAILVLVGMIAWSVTDAYFPFHWTGNLGDGISFFVEGVLGVTVGLLVAAAVVFGLILLAVLGVVGIGLLVLFVVAVVIMAVLGVLAPLAVPVALVLLVVWAVCRSPRRTPPVSAEVPPNRT